MSLPTQLNEYLHLSPYLAIFLHFTICACLGSYFNLFAWRWPQIQEKEWLVDIHSFFQEKKWPPPSVNPTDLPSLSLSKPASFCPNCRTRINPKYNVPVFGWLLLRGRAACCGTKISIKYPFFELICGLLGVFSWLYFADLEKSVRFLLFVMPLCMAAQTDFESMLLPDSITGFIMFTGLLVSIYMPIGIAPKMAILGIVISYITLEAIRIFGRIAFKKEAMGQGDPKFLAAIGAWLGPETLPQILLIASISAIFFAAAKTMQAKLSGDNSSILNSPVPFGPFLALAGAISYIYPIAL